jgi:hypothetical protein
LTGEITNPSRWKPGQSGNPNGRPRRKRALTDLLLRIGEETVIVGGEEMTAKETVARAIWHLAIYGEVSLAGRTLRVETVSEWSHLVKWLYSHLESGKVIDQDSPEEIKVKVLRDETSQPMQSAIVDYEAED